MGEFYKRAIRILYISRKPTKEEYLKVAKITALGMIALGVVGFIISLVFSLI